MQSSIDPQFAQLFSVVDRCSILVRNLRVNLLNAHRYTAAGLESEEELADHYDGYKQRVEKFARELTDEYERLETEAKQLPAQVPVSTMTNRLNNFLLDVSTRTLPPEAYTNSLDAFDWADSTGHHINYTNEFLKQATVQMGARNRKICLGQVLPDRLPPVVTKQLAVEPNLQRRFEEAFRQHLQSQDSNKPRYTYRYLERGGMSCAIEVKLMYSPQATSRERAVAERSQAICLLKFLMLVNNGMLEYAQFIAPHEDWKHLEVNGNQVDLSVESRYDLYRHMTTQGNIVINFISSQSATGDVKNNFVIFLSVVSKFHHLDVPCRQCKKILRDFSPATIGDMAKKFFSHAACK